MNRINVNSSNIASVGYDNIQRLLEIEFHGNDIYQYLNVPQNIYENLMAASSHGKYFDQNIKNVYQYHKIS